MTVLVFSFKKNDTQTARFTEFSQQYGCWQATHLNVRAAMYEVHGVTAYIPSKVEDVVCKLRAQLVCTHQPAQPVLCRLVQDETRGGRVVMLKQEDNSLPDT